MHVGEFKQYDKMCHAPHHADRSMYIKITRIQIVPTTVDILDRSFKLEENLYQIKVKDMEHVRSIAIVHDSYNMHVL